VWTGDLERGGASEKRQGYAPVCELDARVLHVLNILFKLYLTRQVSY
jgi:hypothetical protein